jgi:hypothetical protein
MIQMINFDVLKGEFEKLGQMDILRDLSENYEELLKRKIERIDYPDNAKTFTKKRVESNCKTIQQVLLHRAIHLFRGSFEALSQRNVYSMALCIRGHFEGTAAMGYLHSRIMSFIGGTIGLNDFDQSVYSQMLGCRHKSLSKALDPKNIMTQLEYADKVVDKHFFKRPTESCGILRDDYEYLSEFAHPNFHSNSAAFSVDKVAKSFVFRYDGQLRKEEFSLIGYLSISNPIFIWLFDNFGESLNRIWD